MAGEFLEDQVDNDRENSQLFEIRFCKVKFFGRISVDWGYKEIYHVIIGVKSVEIWLIQLSAVEFVSQNGWKCEPDYVKN